MSSSEICFFQTKKGGNDSYLKQIMEVVVILFFGWGSPNQNGRCLSTAAFESQEHVPNEPGPTCGSHP